MSLVLTNEIFCHLKQMQRRSARTIISGFQVVSPDLLKNFVFYDTTVAYGALLKDRRNPNRFLSEDQKFSIEFRYDDILLRDYNFEVYWPAELWPLMSVELDKLPMVPKTEPNLLARK